MNPGRQVAHKEREFEINPPGPDAFRIPTDGAQPSRAKSALIVCSPLVNYHEKGCESAGGHRHRKSVKRRTGMALKVELKPHERIIIGACVVTNTDQRARLLIDGDRIPILREKDILTPEIADTPAKLVYLAVQLMYLSPDPMAHHPTYFSLVRDILSAMPSAWPFIEGINNYILNGDLYHALKESKKLIGHEEQILENARKLQTLNEPDRKSA
jgi:flagellar protein FlbT